MKRNEHRDTSTQVRLFFGFVAVLCIASLLALREMSTKSDVAQDTGLTYESLKEEVSKEDELVVVATYTKDGMFYNTFRFTKQTKSG